MDVVSSFVGGASEELGKSLSSRVMNALKFQSNLKTLKTEVENLTTQRDIVKAQLHEQAENADVRHYQCRDEVTVWLKAVEDLEREVNSILRRIEAVANTGNRFEYCCLGIKMGMEVANNLTQVKQLIIDGKFPSGSGSLLVETNQPRRVELMPGPSISIAEEDHQSTTASKTLSKVLTKLNDKDVTRIGVWGMGGVGKTTLAKNLNNVFEKSSSSTTQPPFSIVIWATVSKKLDLKRVQTQIAGRLNLPVSLKESVERTASRLYHRLMEEKNFLLILDDVWEPIDLDCLGVPQPELHNSCSKVILTSRSLDVCRQMRTDVEIKVDILSNEESWNLFTRYSGKVATLTHIEPLAKQITRECCGLPLAIVTVGASMRGKEMIELWMDALNALRTSTPHINGIEDRVYRPLKWSYDSLQGMDFKSQAKKKKHENTYRKGIDIKSCFLYCCLYPEDYSIEVTELVHSWLAEGLIDKLQNYEASFNRGIALVEFLKDSCLLEDGTFKESTVRMHDVVRDVGIWIVSFLENERQFLVQSGIGLTHITLHELSESHKRVSFMDNRITNLPDWVIQCPHVSTLLLQDNHLLENVPEGFLLGFQALKVLNLSDSRIQTLPLTLLELGELQALFLRGCYRLENIPSLERLTKLKMINLSGTEIKELPKGMEKLTNLRQLDLSHTRSLTKIRAGIISKLYSLEVLDMTSSAYKWPERMLGIILGGGASFEELVCLKQLSVLSIHLDQSCLYIYSPWIQRLKKFQFFIGEDVPKHPIGTKFDEMRATFFMYNFSQPSGSLQLLYWATSILLEHCEGFEQTPPFFYFTHLKSLRISYARLFEQENEGNYVAAGYHLLPNLEELDLNRVMGINSISYLAGHFGIGLSKLRVIRVSDCHNMNYILSVGGLVPSLDSLEEVTVTSCNHVVDLFRCESSSQTSALVDTSALNLKIVKLNNLRRFKALSEPHFTWQQLEHLEVIKCDLVKKLPFSSTQNLNTIKEIRGESQWWDQLEWDDEETKSKLQQYFTPVAPDQTVHFKASFGAQDWLELELAQKVCFG